MPRTLRVAVIALALGLAGTASAQVAKELVGKYVMEADSTEVLELRADGTASMAGDQTSWSVKGNQLRIGPDTLPYQLVSGRLLLSMGSVQMAWKRVGAASKGPSPMEKAAAKAKAAQPAVSEEEADREALEQAKAWIAAQGAGAPPNVRPGAPAAPGRPQPSAQPVVPGPGAGGSPQDAQLRQLLLSSAWCSFTYNQTSGTSTTRRVVFRGDGVMLTNGGAETYNSGAAGTYAGQSNSAGSVRWKVANLRLYVDQGDGAGFQDIGLTGTRNSSGYPVLTAGGREYSTCN